MMKAPAGLAGLREAGGNVISVVSRRARERHRGRRGARRGERRRIRRIPEEAGRRARPGGAACADCTRRVRRRRRRPPRSRLHDPRTRRGVRLHGDGGDDALRRDRGAHRRRRQGDARRDRGGAAPVHAGVLRDRFPQPLLGAAGNRGGGARRQRAAGRQQELGHVGRARRQLRMVQPAARRRRPDDALAGSGRGRRACRCPGPSTGSASGATRRCR